MRDAIVPRRPRSGIVARDRQPPGRDGAARRLTERASAQAVDIAVDDPAAGARARDLARVLEREAERREQGARTRRDERRFAAPTVDCACRRRRVRPPFADPAAAPALRAPWRRLRARCSRGTGCRRRPRPHRGGRASAAAPGCSRRSTRTPRRSRRSAPPGLRSAPSRRPRRGDASRPPSLPPPRPSSCRSRARSTTAPGSTWAPSATSHSVRRTSSVYAPSFGMITGCTAIDLRPRGSVPNGYRL